MRNVYENPGFFSTLHFVFFSCFCRRELRIHLLKMCGENNEKTNCAQPVVSVRLIKKKFILKVQNVNTWIRTRALTGLVKRSCFLHSKILLKIFRQLMVKQSEKIRGYDYYNIQFCKAQKKHLSVSFEYLCWGFAKNYS